MVILLMGVAGVGKTTIGQALAAELHWRFADADDFHSAENIAKMRAGIPLDDVDRGPWLQALHDAMVEWLAGGENAVLACSALKAAYREILVVSPEVKVVYLQGTFDQVAAHLSGRSGHYMDPNLLRSQFEALEEPHDVPTINIAQSIKAMVDQIRTALDL
jgi:gluconokinase